LSWDWLTHELNLPRQPLFIGSHIVATGAAVLGYCSVYALWRLQVTRTWTRRAGQHGRPRLTRP